MSLTNRILVAMVASTSACWELDEDVYAEGHYALTHSDIMRVYWGDELVAENPADWEAAWDAKRRESLATGGLEVVELSRAQRKRDNRLAVGQTLLEKGGLAFEIGVT